MARRERRPFRLGLLDAIFPEHALAGVDRFGEAFAQLPGSQLGVCVGQLKPQRPRHLQPTRGTLRSALGNSLNIPAVKTLDFVGVDDTIARLDEALMVHEALATLPENCREILDRFFARDESYRHIGEALELPAGTIASRISRCLVKLRGELEGRNPASAESGG
jgi:RNA polymerase sigma factor (sigma-70 family)